MESKLVIFVVFATLAKSSFARTPTEYGLSEEAMAVLNRIIQNEEATAAVYATGLNSIFEVIDKLTVMQNYGLQSKNDDLPCKFTEVLYNAKEAISYTLNSIPLITGRVCLAVETARTAAYVDLERMLQLVPVAIELARSANPYESRAKVTEVSDVLDEPLENYLNRIFGTIRTCVNTNDADELAAINAAEIGMRDGLQRAKAAIFNAIKVFGAGASSKGKDLVDTCDNQFNRKQAMAGLMTAAETSFSPIKSLYINSQLGRTGIASKLGLIQYTQKVSSTKYKEAAVPIFNIIRDYLNRVRLGLSDACTFDLVKINAAQAETAASLKAGLRALVDSAVADEPTPSFATLDTAKYFDDISDNGTLVYYNGLRYALGQEGSYTEALKKIEMLRTGLQAIFPPFVRTNYNLVKRGRYSTDNVDAEVKALQEASFIEGRNFVDHIFNSYLVLAKACYGIGDVNENDFAAVQSAQDGTSFEAESFTANVASADVALILANNPNQVKTTPAPVYAVDGYLPPNNFFQFGVGAGSRF